MWKRNPNWRGEASWEIKILFFYFESLSPLAGWLLLTCSGLESFILTAPAWNSQRGNENGGTNRRVTIIKLLTTKEHKNAWAKMSSSDLKPCEKNFIPCCNLPPEFLCFEDSEVIRKHKDLFLYQENILMTKLSWRQANLIGCLQISYHQDRIELL